MVSQRIKGAAAAAAVVEGVSGGCTPDMGTGLSGMEGGQSQFQLWTGGSLISFTISLSSRPLHTDMQPVQAATFFLNQPGSCLVEKVAQT